MKLSKRTIKGVALAGLCWAAGSQSYAQQKAAQVAVIPADQSCNAAPGQTCTIIPSATFNFLINNLVVGLTSECCQAFGEDCTFNRFPANGDKGETIQANGQTAGSGSITGKGPFTLKQTATNQGGTTRYQGSLNAYCSFNALKFHFNNVDPYPITVNFNYTVTNN